jgi:uncharacterized protein YlaI
MPIERYKACPECKSTNIAIGEARNIRGHVIHPYYCADCGEVLMQYASKAAARAFGLTSRRALKRVYTVTERRLAAGDLDASKFDHNHPCEVCGSTGDTQVHHWAPAHLFGEESGLWPTGYLCQACHTRWHQLVTPNMGKTG